MVEGNGLENRRAGNGTEGSNPSLSAKKIVQAIVCAIFFAWTIYILPADPLSKLQTYDKITQSPDIWRGTQVAQGDGLLNR